MSEPKSDKWLVELEPDDTLGVVVAKSLRSRIDAVCDFLPLAAEHADENVEYVHQLRVWSRRSMAVLRLYRPLLPKKELNWLKRRLKQIRKAAGSARDFDVMLQQYQSDAKSNRAVAFLDQIEEMRCEAQEPIRAVSRKLKRGKRLKRKVRALLGSAKRKRRRKLANTTFADWSGEALQRLVQRFEQAVPSDPTDLSAVHRFRIRSKQLRYGIELMAPAFRDELKDQVYPELQRLQERLGQLNDRAVAVRRLEHWLEEEHDPGARKHLADLLEREQEQRDGAIKELVAWWSSGELQRVLEMVAPIAASTPADERSETQ